MHKKRFRDYGFSVGQLQTGQGNCITDVPGVRVAHVTLNAEHSYAEHVCTGVTAILPHTGNLFEDKVAAASHVINGFGKTTGLVQVDELGELESPILLTNTFGVPAVAEGVLQHMMASNPGIGDSKSSLNVVVGECNDSFLNDMRGLHVRPEHARAAIERAESAGPGPIPEGGVGAGAGMRCFGWKGGIGSASRQVEVAGSVHTIGTLVLTNFGVPGDLTILGYPVGGHLHRPHDETDPAELSDGSIIIVLATDLPADSLLLKRLAKRVTVGLARTGSIVHHGSGDIVIAFSTTGRQRDADPMLVEASHELREGAVLSDCFRAVAEATEEAILNSLCMAETTVGRLQRKIPCLPMEKVVSMMVGQ